MNRQLRTIVSKETLIITRVSETVLEVFDESPVAPELDTAKKEIKKK